MPYGQGVAVILWALERIAPENPSCGPTIALYSPIGAQEQYVLEVSITMF